MDISDFKNWLGALALIVSLGGAFYAWLTSRSKDNSSRLDDHEEKLNGQEKRLASVEHELKHVPNKDDINDLRLEISNLNGSVGRISENLKNVNTTVSRVEDYLLKGDK